MGRAPCCDKAIVKKGPWSPEEDATLKAYIEEHGTGGNWIALPQKIGLKRCGKSCRLRWLNYLRPNIKHGGFSEEEDRIICSLYISIGSRWSIIAAQLPGRTDNDIKNYWNTRLKKKLLGKRKESSQSRRHDVGIRSNDEGDGMNQEISTQGLSESAVERMRLHMQLLQGLCNPHSSLCNNPASLWSKSHLLRERTQFQSQQSHDEISASPVQQSSSEDTKTDRQNYDATFLMHSKVVMSASMHEDVESSTLGFPSPSSAGTTLNHAENPNISFPTVYAPGLPTESHELLYSKTAAFGLQEEPQMDDANWWPSSGFEYEMPSTGSWDSSCLHSDNSLLQDYAIRYDLYASGC